MFRLGRIQSCLFFTRKNLSFNPSFQTFSTLGSISSLVDADQAYSALKSGKSVFLDVRDPAAYNISHIPNAVSTNEIFSYLGTSDQKGKEDMKNYFEKVFRNAGLHGNEHIITYEDCLKTRYGASCRGYYILNLLGHKNVSVLDGGWAAWLKKGYPTSNETPQFNPGSFKAQWCEDHYCGKEEVLEALETKNKVLLDIRDFDEYNGEISSPYGRDFAPRKGRLEGAVHLIWKNLMKEEDGIIKIRQPEEVREIMAYKGLNLDSNIIIYCFKGARAANTFIALNRAGFKNLKIYFASWNEWSRIPHLPIDATLLSTSHNELKL